MSPRDKERGSQAISVATPSTAPPDFHPSAVVEPFSGRDPKSVRSTTAPFDELGFRRLRVWGEMLEDAMKSRIACSNRALRSPVDPIHYLGYLESLKVVEDTCRKELVRCFREVAPVGVQRWLKTATGVGEPSLARLLGHIGHPVHTIPRFWEGSGKSSLPTTKTRAQSNVASSSEEASSSFTQTVRETHVGRREGRHLVEGEPFDRSVSQLWSYCGHGDPKRRRARGMNVDDALSCGSPMAKSIVFLISTAIVKTGRGAYREHYDKLRARYADRVHAKPCVRCGPSGRPAPEGSPWKLGHQHAAALRGVGKLVLRDLWVAAKEES